LASGLGAKLTIVLKHKSLLAHIQASMRTGAAYNAEGSAFWSTLVREL